MARKILSMDDLRKLTESAPVALYEDTFRAHPWRFSLNTFREPDPSFSMLSYATAEEARQAAEAQRTYLLQSLAPREAA